jgi:glutamate dehydrogenase/leucine dehydrogenase
MNVFNSAADGHEQIVFCSDQSSGLRAIISIYSTALGPALGGTRFYPFAGETAALADVLNLSRAMAYKAACAGLDLGGGKAVIIGDLRGTRARPCCGHTAASSNPWAAGITRHAMLGLMSGTWMSSRANADS